MNRQNLLFFFAAVFALISAPARADVSALYVTKSDDDLERKLDFSMTIEVNDDGDARLHVTGTTGYFLIRNGEAYRIYRGIDGPYAEKLSDLDEAIADARELGGISLELLAGFTAPEIQSIGPVEVGQWKGAGYGRAMPDYRVEDEAQSTSSPRYADLVISHEAKLEPIGATFGRLLDSKFGTLRALSLVELFGTLSIYDANMRKLISSGTPIKLGVLELEEVSNDTVDPTRFKLPERVLTPEEIQAQTVPFEWAPAFDHEPKE